MKKQKSKSPKKKAYFIIRLPNGAEVLIKTRGWYGLTNYISYFKEEYESDIVAISIKWWEALKYVLKGKVFPC